MEHLDNLNHEISVGDMVFCLTSSDAKTIKTVCKIGKRKCEPFDDIATVTLDSKITLDAANVISLTKLGLTKDDIDWENIHKAKRDGLGHEIRVGDKILFLHRMECNSQTGTVKKLTGVTFLMEIEKNHFGQTEYRQKYNDVIDLSAIGFGNINVSLNCGKFDDEDRFVINER